MDATLAFLQETYEKYAPGHRIFASSSFQTQSVPLLHLLSSHFKEVPVLFIDTGFLFAETYAFKNELTQLLGLRVITLSAQKTYAQQTGADGLFQYARDTAYCCHINKVEPIQQFLRSGDVWISGVRRDQTSIRKSMSPIEVDARGIIRVHPMLDWSAKAVYDYIRVHQLPRHPLEDQGYMSIGCVPCTHKFSAEGPRGGRWLGSKKTECGLHINK
jgi:phosphoadenosine phosphosulfate reductase